MATTLQDAFGLPPNTPAHSWNLTHPKAVSSVHSSFAKAGAGVLCTNTLCALDPASIRQAVELARSSAGTAEVWLALGPGDPVAAIHAAGPLHGVVLETFLDPRAALVAARRARTVWDGPLVVSIVPDEAGLPRGISVADWLEEAVAIGVTGVGVNCVPAQTVSLALDALGGRLPLWAKPSNAAPNDLLALADRATWLGGCCGTPPETIARISPHLRRRTPPSPS